MKILVINAGSSSLKYQLINMEDHAVLAKGQCERINVDGAFKHVAGDKEIKMEVSLPNHKVAIELVLKYLTDRKYGVIENVSDISAAAQFG